MQALLREEAPGQAALHPRARIEESSDQVGLGWFISQIEGRTITWHNGGTGGFRSFVGLDLAAGRGIVLLAATTRDLDEAALALLTEGAGR